MLGTLLLITLLVILGVIFFPPSKQDENKKSVGLVFLDPQYEKVSKCFDTNYPLYPRSDYQIMRIIEQASWVLKP